ncbi:hypothetical protein HPP92_025485 [Vanilla planifolia]|uniref:Uncharacterized protein n=1 Tax=Vanilla planifolia TaxID=51239 RepID=A0A835UCD9_VANPL|nr:hypothetical protein HPP92_025485 [Vanilla planifolia]
MQELLCNRGAKYHEKMLREFSKRKDDDRNKRMEALKNNDVDRYREMLLQQQTNIPGDAAQKTEEYLHKLGGKIAAAKNNQEMEDAANTAAAAARGQGFSDEEVKAAAACAGQEVLIRNKFSEMNTPKDSSSVNKYYNLAHAVSERVLRQPSMLRAGTLRDYQLVGLQWMLSLYNNKLNGILADEMGLGKTVQSELLNWLPSITCIFYVGGKDQRSKLFTHEVFSMKFNVLVTTYEFVMYDRSKLSKINWKYIIIDEAQRMKDRESVLARDLDRYRCQRRLLLTGTPLQNDLKELWSLLNLLLPEIFDNRKAFHDWFSKPFHKDGSSQNTEEDEWLETEKKVSIVLRCRMSAIQSAIYDWIKSTGTIRVDPEEELRKAQKNPLYQIKMYRSLNNKCMELRKVCNHPLLNYPYFNDYSKEFIVRSCGKLWILDRILLKLQRSGHRVLSFSTMTKLLDILEEYLQWRHLIYRRIDGTTSLEDQEAAIVDFNSPNSDCFIFLLSIRAAGRGLNLQTADTVVIYDPDPNPQNEEQAVARAHRIGQRREVKVIYMEAVVDKITSFRREDEWRVGGRGDLDDDLAGKDRYIGSIEGLIRNNIQQYKIDMADEVINAGRFDQRTTHEERRMTLETLLHDEERYQETVHDVPSLQEVNRMIARDEEEVELFDQMDEEFDWTGDMVNYSQVPNWLRAGSKELNAVTSSLSKKPSKKALDSSTPIDHSELFLGASISKTERRGRPKCSSSSKNHSIYVEMDDEDVDDFDAQSEDFLGDEECETVELDDEEINGAIDVPPSNKDQSDEEGIVGDDSLHKSQQIMEGHRNIHAYEEAGSTGSSSGSRRPPHRATPISSQKFGSLSALESRQHYHSKSMTEELEEGEIAVSVDSQAEFQQSGSWAHDREEGEEEQVVQPKLKRRRSIRIRPRHTVERLEEKSNSEKEFSSRKVPVPKQTSEKSAHGSSPEPAEDTSEHSWRNWNGNAVSNGNQNFVGSRIVDIVQRKCKNVINLWKKNDTSSFVGKTTGVVNLQKIEHQVDNFEYNDVTDFIDDVQSMLKGTIRQCNYSNEAKLDAIRVHELFFDMMKMAFPETDFREARAAFELSIPIAGEAAPPTSRTLRYITDASLQWTRPSPAPAPPSHEVTPRDRPDFPPAHPADLVICKKRRNDRDKQRAAGPSGPATPGWVGPLSPRAGRSARGVSAPREAPMDGRLSPGLKEVQWAKTVKRMRTDTGRGDPAIYDSVPLAYVAMQFIPLPLIHSLRWKRRKKRKGIESCERQALVRGGTAAPRAGPPDANAALIHLLILEIECSLEIPIRNDEDVCPICLEGYDAQNPSITTQCKHHFHLSCILEWMERSSACPICDKVMKVDDMAL